MAATALWRPAIRAAKGRCNIFVMHWHHFISASYIKGKQNPSWRAGVEPNPRTVFSKAQIMGFSEHIYLSIFREETNKSNCWFFFFFRRAGGCLCSACLCWRDRKSTAQTEKEQDTVWIKCGTFIHLFYFHYYYYYYHHCLFVLILSGSLR